MLYRLLSHPEHLEPLRKEVEAVVAEEGWTKAGMEKMHKIDSFVRETLRIDGQSISSLSCLPSIKLRTADAVRPTFCQLPRLVSRYARLRFPMA